MLEKAGGIFDWAPTGGLGILTKKIVPTFTRITGSPSIAQQYLFLKIENGSIEKK